MKKNAVVQLSTQFAIDVIAFCETLTTRKKNIISNQLLKSGTSIGANIAEAQNAESRADFVHKLKIAAKEARETQYWLYLCERSPSYPHDPKLQSTLVELIRLIDRIIVSAKRGRG